MCNTPCGSCDIGVYNELALLNKKSRQFGVLDEKERCKNIPKCKNENHVCYGAIDFHELIKQVDRFSGVKE